MQEEGQKHNNKYDRKKTVEDCCFCIGLVNRASNYDATLQLIANHAKKTCVRGNNMSEALWANVKPDVTDWKPALEFEESIEDADNTRLNKQHKLKCKMEYDAYLKRKETCEQNLHKACAELWERCAMAVKAKLEARTTFKSDACDDLIMLVKAIKEHSLCFEELRCKMAAWKSEAKGKKTTASLHPQI